MSNIVDVDTDMVSSVAWAPDGQLLTAGDDKILCKWGADGDLAGKITSLSTYITSISWLPSLGKQVLRYLFTLTI